jgi:hypothetical protein
MPSIGSSLKQIPLNNGYFRTVNGTITSDYLSMYTVTVNAAGFVTDADALGASPANYNGLLRDMGVQYKGAAGTAVAGLIYRRVQVVPAATAVGGGATGSADTDYDVYYIIIGRDGDGAPGPFVRTG